MRCELRLPGAQFCAQTFGGIAIDNQQEIDTAILALRGFFERRPRAQFPPVMKKLLRLFDRVLPRPIILRAFAGARATDRQAVGGEPLLARCLAKSEMHLLVPETESHHLARALQGDQVVKERQVKMRDAAGIERRLKSKAGKWRQHREFAQSHAGHELVVAPAARIKLAPRLSVTRRNQNRVELKGATTEPSANTRTQTEEEREDDRRKLSVPAVSTAHRTSEFRA